MRKLRTSKDMEHEHHSRDQSTLQHQKQGAHEQDPETESYDGHDKHSGHSVADFWKRFIISTIISIPVQFLFGKQVSLTWGILLNLSTWIPFYLPC